MMARMSLSLRNPLERASFRKLAFELFLVFVAVSAALFANAWWQGRQAAAAGRTALAAFASEIRANREQIAARIDHHRDIVGNSQGLLADLQRGVEVPRDIAALRDRLTNHGGMRTPILSSAAWSTALASGVAAEIPYETLQRIASAYEVQRKLEFVLDNLIGSFTSPSYFDPDNISSTVTSFMVTFSMIVELEVDQLRNYDGCLELLADGR